MIFKPLTSGDSFFVEMEQSIFPLFSSSVIESKTGTGWTVTKNSGFLTSPTVTSSVYFVNDNSFYITYASSSTAQPEYNLPWQSLVSTITTEFDFASEERPLYFNNTKITEAIIISVNSDYVQQGLDYDNFFLVVSGSTSATAFTDVGGNGQFNVTNNLVLAPYYIKNSANDFSTSSFSVNDKFISLTPAYELRSSDDASFLTYNASTGQVTIDWTAGTTTAPYGIVFPEVGLIVLFPELFGRAQITTAIRTVDKSLNSLKSLMFIGGYAEKKVDKQIYFARLGVNEFNKTLNASAYEIVDGSIRTKESFVNNPMTYPTRVGLYNEYNECLAVGFFSQPEQKTSLDELPIRLEITM